MQFELEIEIRAVLSWRQMHRHRPCIGGKAEDIDISRVIDDPRRSR
jgi:hypothetical protein